jgi:transcriptional regulator of NAD metabolism
MTGLIVKNLACLNSKELSIPQTSPINNEKNARVRKLPSTFKGVEEVNSPFNGLAYSYTVLNRMIQTASFVIPSPNTKLNNFG